MDLVAGVERVEVFRFVEVPEHGNAVLAAGGAEGAVGGDGDGVDVAGVADVVGLDAAGGEIPDLCRISIQEYPLIAATIGYRFKIPSGHMVNVGLMARRL